MFLDGSCYGLGLHIMKQFGQRLAVFVCFHWIHILAWDAYLPSALFSFVWGTNKFDLSAYVKNVVDTFGVLATFTFCGCSHCCHLCSKGLLHWIPNCTCQDLSCSMYTGAFSAFSWISWMVIWRGFFREHVRLVAASSHFHVYLQAAEYNRLDRIRVYAVSRACLD